MRAYRFSGLCMLIGVLAGTAAAAQEPEPPTRQAMVAEEQAQKVGTLHPYTPTATERLMVRVEDMLVNRTITWHPFFESAAHGGGLPLGVGYMQHVSPYNYIDVRGSYSVAGYRRAEAEFVAPRLFERRGSLSVIGGWRDANQIAFYGLGSDSSVDNRANYGVKEGYGSALLTVWPTRRLLMLRGGVELARWSPQDGAGSPPPVERIYTPATLPGLGATMTYVHTQATVGLDWRPAPGYARRGGF